MRILAILVLFLSALKICWAQPADDICICELENTAAFTYFDSNTPTAVSYPKETIYSVFSFTSSWEEPEAVAVPSEAIPKPIYGAIPEEASSGAELGNELEGAAPEESEERVVVQEQPIAEVAAEVQERAEVGSGGGGPTEQGRASVGRAKRSYAGGGSIKGKRKRNPLIPKRKKRGKKYKGKCPAF